MLKKGILKIIIIISNMEIIIGGRFKISKKLGAGAFGIAVSGVNMKTNEEVGIKMELMKNPCPML